jgi:phosphate acetyltransferase
MCRPSGHILLAPDLDSGNILAKQLEYLAGAQIAGIVLGARILIVLTSRADKTSARLASCAIALLLARSNAGYELLGAGQHGGWSS